MISMMSGGNIGIAKIAVAEVAENRNIYIDRPNIWQPWRIRNRGGSSELMRPLVRIRRKNPIIILGTPKEGGASSIKRNQRELFGFRVVCDQGLEVEGASKERKSAH